mgnify:CR=1 FL=1
MPLGGNFWMSVVGGSRESPSLMQSRHPCETDGRLHLLLPRPMAVRCQHGPRRCKPLPEADAVLAEGLEIACAHQVQKVGPSAFGPSAYDWGDHPAAPRFHDCPAPGAQSAGMCRCCAACTKKCRASGHVLKAPEV